MYTEWYFVRKSQKPFTFAPNAPPNGFAPNADISRPSGHEPSLSLAAAARPGRLGAAATAWHCRAQQRTGAQRRTGAARRHSSPVLLARRTGRVRQFSARKIRVTARPGSGESLARTAGLSHESVTAGDVTVTVTADSMPDDGPGTIPGRPGPRREPALCCQWRLRFCISRRRAAVAPARGRRPRQS
jgi:hypothetical protein